MLSRLESLRSAALAPLTAAQLLSAYKSFEDSKILGSPRLNQWGLHRARVRLAHRLARGRRRRLAHLISDDKRAEFHRDGFVIHRRMLPDETFARLVDQVQTSRGRAREKREGDTLMRKIDLDERVRQVAPALASLLDNPLWRDTIAYVGACRKPPVVYLQSLFRGLGGGRDPQTLLHADTFHPTVKAWFYLTDVDVDSGPLLYVPGSHRLDSRRLAWEQRTSVRAREAANGDTRQGSFRISADELAELGLPPPRPMTVAANTLIVADTFGFHARGSATEGASRVEVWAIGPRSPFLDAPIIDRWLARVGRRRDPDEWTVREATGAFDPPSPARRGL